MNNKGVFNIPAEMPFVDSLAAGILDIAAGDPVKLSEIRVLLPTRRACRALSDAFLRLLDGRAALLPLMMPLGDVDGDELLMEGFSETVFNENDFSDDLSAFPQAIDPLRRTLMLARLIMARKPTNDAEKNNTRPDQAIRLAGELANLIDQVATERLDLEKLGELVPKGDLSEHWQQTLDFLEIISKNWPSILASEACVDPATRRGLLLAGRAKSWAEKKPSTPIIAAGSTGSIPATADLLKVVASLPQGFVVLPGVDMEMNDELYSSLEPGHPQFGMAQLLKHIGVGRSEVKPWTVSSAKTVSTQGQGKAQTRIINMALVPAGGADEWRKNKNGAIDASALENVTRINAPTPQDEATAIALIMRETLETPGKTVALITPDRSLARRVGGELKRWDILVDDSAGTPLGKTPPGAFFELVGEMVAGGFHPIGLLACLKHPLCGPIDDLARAKFRRAVRTLEAGLLRGARPASGLEGLEDAFRVLNRDEHKIKMLGTMGMDTDAIRDVLLLLKDACGEFIDALIAEKPNPEEIIKAHAKAAVMLCGGSENPQHARLWHGDAGVALGEFIGSLAIEINTLGAINAIDYPALINALISARAVRLQSGAHPRVFIWGLLEARLQRSDVTILGGLNEGTWPGEAKPSPWMSRPMQKQFGLPLPERRIGLAAHDFCQAFGGPEVFITRSDRVDGTPQVPSRWLVRLETMLEGAGLMDALEPGPKYSWAEWVGELSKTEKQQDPAKWEPRPRPEVKLRPKKLSVTEIETLIRDPYAIYAKHILKLNPLDDIDADPGAADRGIIVHDALERFIAENMKTLPDNALARLLEIGDMSFKENLSAPTVHAFWWPRFERIARWFLEREQKSRANGQMPSAIEQRGQIKIDGLSGEFILSARVDRIDVDETGGLIIIDYKTGTPPTTPQVEAGFSPQLPLEAAMAKMGAFADVKKGAAISGLLYLQLSGGREAGTEKPIKLDSEQAASDALGGLSKLLQRFENEKTPYLSRPRPMWENRFSDYDHLARVKEWSGSGGGDA